MKVTNLYKPSEDDEQAAVVDFCNLFGIDVVHVPNEGKRSPATAAKLKRLGLRPGVPDLFFPIPSGEYHGLFIEMKAQGGRPTPDQKRWIAKLSAKGYRATVCVGADASGRMRRFVKSETIYKRRSEDESELEKKPRTVKAKD